MSSNDSCFLPGLEICRAWYPSLMAELTPHSAAGAANNRHTTHATAGAQMKAAESVAHCSAGVLQIPLWHHHRF